MFHPLQSNELQGVKCLNVTSENIMPGLPNARGL